jgi:hypothetical protein
VAFLKQPGVNPRRFSAQAAWRSRAGLDHSRPGRAGSKSGHVRYSVEAEGPVGLGKPLLQPEPYGRPFAVEDREHDRVTEMSGPVLIFRTEPVEQADRDNLIAGCSGYFDRTSLALK